MREESINEISRILTLQETGNRSSQERLKALEEEINRLLNDDFHRLISILYRIDVSEEKLKRLLKENTGQDAAKIILNLLLARQEQKLQARTQFGKPADKHNNDEEERW